MRLSRPQVVAPIHAIPELRFEDQRLTSFSGLVIFQALFQRLRLKERLAADGFRTVGDFLLALPFRYEDRSRFASVAALEWGKPATILVRFQGVRAVRMRRGMLRIEAAADDGTGAVRVVWHNRYPSFVKALEGSHADERWAYPQLVVTWAESYFRNERDAATRLLAELDALGVQV